MAAPVYTLSAARVFGVRFHIYVYRHVLYIYVYIYICVYYLYIHIYIYTHMYICIRQRMTAGPIKFSFAHRGALLVLCRFWEFLLGVSIRGPNKESSRFTETAFRDLVIDTRWSVARFCCPIRHWIYLVEPSVFWEALLSRLGKLLRIRGLGRGGR